MSVLLPPPSSLAAAVPGPPAAVVLVGWTPVCTTVVDGRIVEGGPGLEDEDSIRVTLGVERQRAGDSERRRRLVDTGRQCVPAEVGRLRVRGGRCASRRIVVGDRQVGLGLEAYGIGCMDLSVDLGETR